MTIPSIKAKALLGASALFASLTLSASAFACACGCGIFDVGTASMFPSGKGGTVFLEYDYMNQTRNWSGTSKAPAEDNDDKDIRSNFFVAGLQYMFSRNWGVEVTVPYTDRHFTTTDEDSGDIVSFDHSNLGDIRIHGIYTGFSDDLSTGITFGVKLATGDYTYPNFDRDTAIGTGSTDLLLGGFHRGNITRDGKWGYFAQVETDTPVANHNYRPGFEADAAAGIQFNGISLGSLGKITPIGQVLYSHREHDKGSSADPANSGYDRLLLSPGLEYDIGRVMLYGDAEFPVYQDMRGDQLVAPVLFKFIVSYMF